MRNVRGFAMGGWLLLGLNFAVAQPPPHPPVPPPQDHVPPVQMGPAALAAEKADAGEVLVGEVTDVHPLPNGRPEENVTVLKVLQVVRSRHDSRPGALLEIRHLWAPGAKPMRRGDRVVIFLRKEAPQAPFFLLAGGEAGILRLKKDLRANMGRLDALIRETQALPELPRDKKTELIQRYEAVKSALAAGHPKPPRSRPLRRPPPPPRP